MPRTTRRRSVAKRCWPGRTNPGEAKLRLTSSNVVQCCTSTCIHKYRAAYVRTDIHTYIPTYLPTYLPTYIHTYIHTYIIYVLCTHTTYTRTDTCIHTCTSTHTHTEFPLSACSPCVRLRQTGLLLRELEELACTPWPFVVEAFFPEDRKKAAVQNEDYDAAKALKSEIDRLRSWTAV